MKAMKATRKMFAFLLAAIMMMAMSVTVFAGNLGTGNGSITITNATVDKSYSIYKIFDTLSDGKGVTATEAQKNFYEGKGNNPFTFTPNGTGNYIVGTKSDASNVDVSNFLQSFVTEDNEGNIQVDSGFAAVTDVSQPQIATDTEVSFDNIPYGYYLVTSSLGTVITVDATDPDKEVIDKNQDGGSNFTKTVDGTDEVVEIGEEFDFTLNFDATNYDGETLITEYTITDTLPGGMDLVYSDGDSSYGVEVKVNENLISGATINYDNSVLTIKIPWATNPDGTYTSTYPSPSKVKVTYTVSLNENAAIQQDIENNATLTWDGNEKGTHTEETVKTFALAIMKVDGKGNALANATFAVTKDGVDGEPVDVNISPVAGQPGYYVVDSESNSNEVVSPKEGLIVIKGVDNVVYTLTETKAPAGYNLLKEAVTITPAQTGTTTITIYKDASGNVVDTETENTSTVTSDVSVTAEVVVNEAGALLPSTGGMGTTVIYIIGAVLVIGAGIVLVVRRRTNA